MTANTTVLSPVIHSRSHRPQLDGMANGGGWRRSGVWGHLRWVKVSSRDIVKLKHVRAKKTTLPVLVLTAYSRVEERVKGLDLVR